MENGEAQPFQEDRCGNVGYLSNRTFEGDLIPRIDPATGKVLLEYDGDADDAFVLNMLLR